MTEGAIDQPRRIPLPILLTPLVTFAAVATVADIIGPSLITDHPLLQMFLQPRNRYLILAAPQVDTWSFFLVGFLRLVLSDPLWFLLGVQYGDAALRWADRALGEEAGVVGLLLRWFRLAAPAIVFIAPSGYVCLLAGATGMRVRRFIVLNVSGTVCRLVLFKALGEAFRDQLLDLIGWMQRYRWWLVALAFVAVSISTVRARRAGTLGTVSEIEAEIEAAEQELAAGDESPRGDGEEHL